MNRKEVTDKAVRAASVRSTADSARLEGRALPKDYKRPQKVQKILDAILTAGRA